MITSKVFSTPKRYFCISTSFDSKKSPVLHTFLWWFTNCEESDCKPPEIYAKLFSPEFFWTLYKFFNDTISKGTCFFSRSLRLSDLITETIFNANLSCSSITLSPAVSSKFHKKTKSGEKKKQIKN